MIFIFYSVAYSYHVKPLGKMPKAFAQKDNEPVIFPAAFDKFYGGELHHLLTARDLKTLIVTGASSNQAVLYTATAAVRPFGYDVVVPVDGLIARGDYEHEYTLHQFTILPAGAAEKFKITLFDRITFKQ